MTLGEAKKKSSSNFFSGKRFRVNWNIFGKSLLIPKLQLTGILTTGSLRPIMQHKYKRLYLRNKTCFPCLHRLVKTESNVWENSSSENPRCSRGFSPAREFSKTMRNMKNIKNKIWKIFSNREDLKRTKTYTRSTKTGLTDSVGPIKESTHRNQNETKPTLFVGNCFKTQKHSCRNQTNSNS